MGSETRATQLTDSNQSENSHCPICQSTEKVEANHYVHVTFPALFTLTVLNFYLSVWIILVSYQIAFAIGKPFYHFIYFIIKQYNETIPHPLFHSLLRTICWNHLLQARTERKTKKTTLTMINMIKYTQYRRILHSANCIVPNFFYKTIAKKNGRGNKKPHGGNKIPIWKVSWKSNKDFKWINYNSKVIWLIYQLG